MKLRLTRTRPIVEAQRLLPFQERAERRERQFKRAIVAATAVALVGLVAGTRMGRFAAAKVAARARWALEGAIGLEPSREEIDADWRLRRMRGVEVTRARYRKFFDAKAPPGLKRVLAAGGMAPDDALIRWANFDWTVIWSSKVFEADDRGRSYRLRPDTRACWMSPVDLPDGMVALYLLPDSAEVRKALVGSGLRLIEIPQTTNSWGCRGPEPDPGATLRGLVLGDSFMQGFFLGDGETPPARLQHHLAEALGVSVSVLNTGTAGYSPEQYYYTLREFADRMRPHFVIVAIYENDFGDDATGRGWSDGQYYLNEIQQLCRSREIPCLLAIVPDETQVISVRHAGTFPGRVSDISLDSGPYYFDPTDPFIGENLRLKAKATRAGARSSISPLFNGRIRDHHFSARGSDLWARLVGRRLVRLLKNSIYPLSLPPTLRARFAAGRGEATGRDPLMSDGLDDRWRN